MNQILHIFQKDTRRFWGEIFLSIAITAAFAWVYPQQWVGTDHVHLAMKNQTLVGYQIQIIGGFLLALVPVSWLLLIVRIVHEENLVGDRRFWLTRPYEWPKLLAAKLLFLLAFLYVPVFIAQCAILAETGFTPSAYIPGLLYNLLLLTIVMVLPVFALATVTSNFGRLVLALLGVFLGSVFLGSLVNRFLPTRFTGISGASYPPEGALAIAFLLCAVVIVLQYVLRPAVLSRALLFGIPALLILGAPLSARFEQHHNRVDADYPVSTTPLIQLAYHPLDPNEQGFETYPDNGDVLIHTPIHGAGVPPGTVIVPDAVKLEIDAPNGFHWASDWQGAGAPKFYADSQDADAPVAMPHSIYEQIKALPLTLHITLALTQARQTSVQRVALPSPGRPNQDFSVPGFGVCAPLGGSITPFTQAVSPTGLLCRSALREPPLTYIGVVWSNYSCAIPFSGPDPQAGPRITPDPGAQGADWVGSLDRAPADLNISSVQQVNISLSNSGIDESKGISRYLCPGSPVTFTQFERVSRAQASLTIHGYHLPAVTVSNGETHVVTTTKTTTVTPNQK